MLVNVLDSANHALLCLSMSLIQRVTYQYASQCPWFSQSCISMPVSVLDSANRESVCQSVSLIQPIMYQYASQCPWFSQSGISMRSSLIQCDNVLVLVNHIGLGVNVLDSVNLVLVCFNQSRISWLSQCSWYSQSRISKIVFLVQPIRQWHASHIVLDPANQLSICESVTLIHLSVCWSMSLIQPMTYQYACKCPWFSQSRIS